jgi:hypothetical protein
MKISLLTRKPGILSLDFLKEKIRFLINKKTGPISVLESIRRGLSELNIDFTINKEFSDITYVISGIKTLKYALKNKEKGKIKKLIVGPAIVVLPNEENNILLNKNIDTIILPSKWNKDLFYSIYPELENKIRILPAGVKKCNDIPQNKDGILIFNKNNNKITEEIYNIISNKYKTKIIKYGHFKQKEYYSLLNKYKYLIYISNSESQGIALQEAWVRDIPTLVWNKGFWEYKNIKWNDEKISAPYLNERCGMFFKDIEDFKTKFEYFIHNNYEPQKYCSENLLDKNFAQNLLNVIYEKNN